MIAVARLLPKPINEPRRRQIGAIARMALAAGTEGNDLAAALLAELRRDGAGLDLGTAAGILADAGRADLAAPLLPSLEEAKEGKDVSALELRVKQLRAARQRDPKAAALPEIWQAVEALVGAAATGTPARRFAIEQAAQLLPQLPKADAAAWIGRIGQTDPETGVIEVESTVRAFERTGVEMEAMVSASVGALTIYDMCKGVDKGIRIGEIVLLYKEGGKSGLYRREDKS